MNPNFNILYIGNVPAYFDNIEKKNKWSIITLENSARATNYLNTQKHPDAIICDYNLAGNNGIYFFDWIREKKEFDSIPFILLSREFNADIYKSAFKKQIDDFYVTSVTAPEDILNRIEFLCGNKNPFREKIALKAPEENYIMPLSKRVFDVFVASMVLLFASPFLLLIILAIRLESKGKVYYISKRVGRKTFDFYKLRSMRTGSDELLKKLAQEKNQYKKEQATATTNPLDIPCPKCSELPEGESCSPLMYIETFVICDYWFNVQKREAAKNNSTFVKIVDDPRVTKVGKFIRNTSIDELPQLINVLKGDMSIVGNRPLPVYEAELLTADDISKRFLAPPGITGLWQVELRGKGGKMSEEERMRLDNEYADHFKGDNYSFWYDLKLILRTIPALLQKGSV
ncbi:sugar transferase [Flavobacterium cheongpyeongense]|jgi:lipopolysaccharide/colanic/teichoic acid biosynthesis glycosyltransferase/CheY-like chemotaxis protein|uniref:Sugar transferase n=1 Tax=Flavobacterium cheongpyeongense TaxID=2212651 RepID=A0A2V4BMH2_9FLAO|nr:sugar transferase [Flavobacterium cheongpyeongense]PXY39193.1 sugar transferase [Flavobacterium cheongpyeongense]